MAITLSNYIASRPAATTPLADDDRLLVLQSGSVKLVASGDTGGGAIETALINAAATPSTILPASGEIVYKKSDDSETVANFVVYTVGQTMCQELQDGLQAVGDFIRVKLIGNHWYKIG
jgi:hypothetical protein